MPDIQMKPGNRTPGRYRKSTLSVAMAALIAAGASAPTLYEQFLQEKEGDVYGAYQDGVGIWTICLGLTRIDGKPVTKGMSMTPAQCDHHNAKALAVGLAQMERAVKPQVWQGLSEPAKAGIASFCAHNIGLAKCKSSTFYRLLNSGAPANDYCAEITRWIRDQGKDCRKAGSNCQGQPVRRMQEDELCLIPRPVDPAVLQRIVQHKEMTS